jgi:hypothetical protein
MPNQPDSKQSSKLDIEALSLEGLKGLLLEALEKIGKLEAKIVVLSEENARLKGLKGRPNIKPPVKPSGMEEGTKEKKGGEAMQRRGQRRQRTTPIDVILHPSRVPEGAVFKGYEDYWVQDIELKSKLTRYRRQRWETADGKSIVADLPGHVKGHVGAELKRFIIMEYHQGQTTIPRLVEVLGAMGVEISKRQIVRILTEGNELFREEARAVLRAAFAKAKWIAVDDTGARHKGKNGYCTQIGNDDFTFFATTASKSRINFLALLRAGYTDYVLNDFAFDYMKKRNMPDWVIAKLEEHPQRRFADEAAWVNHLAELGLVTIKVHPNPELVATEGALWGTVMDHEFLQDAVILSDDAGQFNVGLHALCWVHAERLIYRLDALCESMSLAKEDIRDLVWAFYRDLKAYKKNPTAGDKSDLSRQFDAIFGKKSGYAAIDRLLERLRNNKSELLVLLDHPETPLNTNISENDIRTQVTRRKISATTRSDNGRDSKDAFLSLLKTCKKLGVSFWDYLGDRLGIPPPTPVPSLAAIVSARYS